VSGFVYVAEMSHDGRSRRYGYSNFICFPDGMAHLHSAGTGNVMRPDPLRTHAREAGFSDVEIMPIETDMWRFYRLV
jgi:hypothetical protein